jgi:hypothetical protein
MAMMRELKPADKMCPLLAFDNKGPGRCSISKRAIIKRLKRLLPRTMPMAKLGAFTMLAALIPLANSGMEVITAKSRRPTQALLNPVFSAIASPYLESLFPETITIEAQIRNFTQTKNIGESPYKVKANF